MTPLNQTATSTHIQASGIAAVIRLREAARVRALADALIAGGLSVLEITMTVPGAVAVIEALSASLPEDVVVGAGTVLDVESLRRVVDAGARFVVSPVFDPALLEAGQALGVDVIPGCFTPTEVHAATRSGAGIVKVFPAGPLGPAFIKDLLGPLPHLKLMPTGGVTLGNAGDWIKAGAVAVGIGSALIDPAAVSSGRFDEISARARALYNSIQAARHGAPPAASSV